MHRLARSAILLATTLTFASHGLATVTEHEHPGHEPDTHHSLLLAAPTGADTDGLWRDAAGALGHRSLAVFPANHSNEAAQTSVTLARGSSESFGWIEVLRIDDVSDDRTAPLEQVRTSLEAAQGEYLMLAVDRAWWSGTRQGSGWEAAHNLLAEDGRVLGVCAVGEGLLRDDGVIDGIRYFGIPFADRAGPGDLERFNEPALVLVSSEGEGLALTRIDPAGVRWLEGSSGAQLDDVLRVRDSLRIEGGLVASPEGGQAGSYDVLLTNPTQRELSFSLSMRASQGWAFTPSRLEGTVAPDDSFRVTVSALSPTLEARPDVRVVGVVRVPLDESGEQGVRVGIGVPVSIALAEPSSSESDPDRVLALNGRSAVGYDLPALAPPYTIEAWARAHGDQSDAVLWSAPGLLMRWAGPESESPVPTVALNDASGIQRTLVATGEGVREQWTHLALCVEPGSASLFVDGVRSASVEADFSSIEPGTMLIGGTIGSFDTVVSGFRGHLGAFRVSTTFRYNGAFTPSRELTLDDATVALFRFDEDLSPVFRNRSPRSPHGWAHGDRAGARVVPEPRGP